MKKSSMLVVLVTLMFVGFALTGAVEGASTDGSGDDRYVQFYLADATVEQEYNTSVNMTVPEVVYESYTFTGSFEHTRLTGNESFSLATNVTVTFANATDTFVYYATVISASANSTADVSVATTLTEGTYWVSSIVVSDNGSASADTFSPTAETFNVTVLTSMAYTIQVTTVNLILALIPLIVIFVVVLPIIFKLLKDVGEEASN